MAKKWLEISANTWPERQTHTKVPTGTTPTTPTLVINPASATADATLLWLGVNDVARFLVDEDGDIAVPDTLIIRKIAGGNGNLNATNIQGVVGTFTSSIKTGIHRSRFAHGGPISIGAETETGDSAVGVVLLGGQTAQAAAAVNQDGGNTIIHAGDHATGGGIEGSVKHVNADGSTVTFETTENAIGFFGQTPVGRQAFTAVSDPPTQAQVTAMRDGLINLGLMDPS